MNYTLKLDHHFAAAHQLTNAYSSECNDFLHGHNWKIRVIIKTNELKNNMVVDFKKIKEIVNQLDHRNLNQILDFEPTAENISKFLYEEIKKLNDNGGKKWEVTIVVWEADGASISCEK